MRRSLVRLAAAVSLGTRIKKKGSSAEMSKIQLDTSKAGLSGVNKKHVNAIIEECSKNSAFYKNEKRMEAERKRRNTELLEKAKQYRLLPLAEKKTIIEEVDQVEEELEAGRHFGNYVHVDMDMFYAAVEMKKNPSLASVPLGVGSAAMLSTTNYAARRHGVRSGMPGFVGRRLCPALVVVPPDFPAYRAEAAAVRRLAAAYDPHFTSVGLDELTMEVSAHLQGAGSRSPLTAADIAAEFRARVFAETQLTASAGIAPTATLAKIASNYNKPNGQHDLQLHTREEVIAFMKDLPVRKVPGIGPVQERVLASLGIRTCGAILRQKYKLRFLFPYKTFRFYLSAGLGLATSSADRLRMDRSQKTIGHEVTFRRKLKSEKELQQIVINCLAQTHDKLLKRRESAQLISLHMKRRSFENHQYNVTLEAPTNDFSLLWQGTLKLLQPHLEKFDDFRLAGVRLGKLKTLPRRQRLSKNGSLASEFDIQIELPSFGKDKKKIKREDASLLFLEKKRICFSV
ncbi:DNA polymerase kappa [Trypanosoma theileri]|uniref:DNA polymerase kappa n=1 Tax=Trypanosoma theileri TaxID=67003 RepID=A0A1X0NZ35_9TRYP|nr:DNA polymerase kappa [Trypanosoma theileri]ORC89808.1 DNA polymerase kappa [Trypanosoma theileri]